MGTCVYIQESLSMRMTCTRDGHVRFFWRAYSTSSWLTFKRILCSRSRRPDSTSSSLQAPKRQQTAAAWEGVGAVTPKKGKKYESEYEHEVAIAKVWKEMGIFGHNLQGKSPGYKSAQGNKSWALFIHQKFPVWNLENSTCPLKWYTPVVRTWPRPPRFWFAHNANTTKSQIKTNITWEMAE